MTKYVTTTDVEGPFYSPLCWFLLSVTRICLTVASIPYDCSFCSILFFFSLSYTFVKLMVKLPISEWLIFFYITIHSYYSGCPSFSSSPSLVVLLFSQFWGHNRGTGRGAGIRAELRTDGGSDGQRPDASETVGLSSRWLLHPHVCHPLGFSHSLSFCNLHGSLMSFPAPSCFALSILSPSADVQISSLRKQWIGGDLCANGKKL